MLLVAEPVLGPEYVATVEGADAEAVQRLGHLILQSVQPVVLDQDPEEVLVREALGLVRQALLGERLVDVRAVLGVAQALLALGLGALAGRADVHHRQAGPLGEGEGARVERVRELLVVLRDHAGAAAVGAIELDQLDAEGVGDQCRRAVQLGREAAAHAAGPVRQPHSAISSAIACGDIGCVHQDPAPGARPVSVPGLDSLSAISSGSGSTSVSGASWSASSPRM